MAQELEWSRKSDFELHPAGEWRAQFVEWERDVHEKFGVQVKLTFDTEVLMDDNRPYRISTWCKPSLHPKGKVYKLLQALGNDPDEISDEQLRTFTLDDYIGGRCRLAIVHEKKKDSDDVTHKINGFLPYKKAPVKTANWDEEPESGGDKAAQQQPAKEPATAGKSNAKGKKTQANWDDED